MKTATTTSIFENEISIKNMIKKAKEEGSKILLTGGGTISIGSAVSCIALFDIPNLKLKIAR